MASVEELVLAEFYHISSTIAYLATLTFSQNQKSQKLEGLTHSNFTEFSTLFSTKIIRLAQKKSYKTKVELSIDIFCLPAIKSRDIFLNIILKQMLVTQKKSQNLDSRTFNQYLSAMKFHIRLRICM